MVQEPAPENINLPFAVWDEGDMMFFDTLDDARKWIEPDDAAHYKAFDGEGRALDLKIETRTGRKFLGLIPSKFDVVTVVPSEHSEETMAELKNYLLEYLEICVGDTQSFETQDLYTLFAKAHDVAEQRAGNGDAKTVKTGLFSYK